MIFKSINVSTLNNFKHYCKSSSNNWLKQHVNDEFVKRARYENFRARSAFKLIEIDKKHDIIRPGDSVIDLGAAPGSWTQVATRIMKLNQEYINHTNKKACLQKIKNGLILAVDILPINSIEGAVTIGNIDFTKSLNQMKIITLLKNRKVDLVMSDMAPNASGINDLDHINIINLAIINLQFAIQVLQESSGIFLVKLWNGHKTNEFKKEYLEKFFKEVYLLKPFASKDNSRELYLLGKKFRGLKRL